MSRCEQFRSEREQQHPRANCPAIALEAKGTDGLPKEKVSRILTKERDASSADTLVNVSALADCGDSLLSEVRRGRFLIKTAHLAVSRSDWRCPLEATSLLAEIYDMVLLFPITKPESQQCCENSEQSRQWDRQREDIHPAEVLERLTSVTASIPSGLTLPPAVPDTEADRPVRALIPSHLLLEINPSPGAFCSALAWPSYDTERPQFSGFPSSSRRRTGRPECIERGKEFSTGFSKHECFWHRPTSAFFSRQE